MTTSQPGVLAPVPRLARYITFSQEPETDVREALAALVEITDGERLVLGIGQSLALDLGCEVEGLRVFPAHAGPGFDVPSTQSALWCWLRGDDRGDLVHMGREVQRVAQSAFTTDEIVDAFQHGASRDLTGYEDGTENPRPRPRRVELRRGATVGARSRRLRIEVREAARRHRGTQAERQRRARECTRVCAREAHRTRELRAGSIHPEALHAVGR